MTNKNKKTPGISSPGLALHILANGKKNWFMSSPDQYRHVFGRGPVIKDGYTVVMPGFGEVCVDLVIDPVDDKPRFVKMAWAVPNPFARSTERHVAHLTSMALLRGDTNARMAKTIIKRLGEIVSRQ